MSRVLILGATGFVGQHVRPAVEADGHQVRLTSRDPASARREHGGDWVAFDVEHPTADAFQDVTHVLYLVHQMRSGEADLVEREQEAAACVARLAADAGVERIVFLGAPDVPDASHHLEARVATGRTLRDGEVPCVELQAAMIIGAGSESWLICRDLAFRLPAMTLPPWARSKTQPIGIDDVVEALVRSLTMPIEGSVALCLPGPETLSAEQILRRVARHRGFEARMVHVPFLSPRLSSHWLRLITRADIGIARQLIDGLETDLICQGESFWARNPDLDRTPFDEAVRRALAEDEASRGARLWERVAKRLGRRT